jgi:signal transduction histidine kinase/CheY-like chemotaxis protein
MTEVTRLESRLESKAKSDFISSISHELRSPLQGILCGIDLLSEQNSADLPILSQIETCSTTLLEVINHLLDFAKINNLSGREKLPSDSYRRRNSLSRPEIAAKTFPEIPMETYSYANITEEVCDSMFYSHTYNQEPRSATKVDLILDVSVDANVQHISDVGAWKRICINVINNALKYTQEGHVAVSLRAGLRKDGHPLIVLSVVDTGRGMSPEFLNNRLFRPFEQEDDLSQGTGLGMSIVSKLVDSLGGNIEVQSLKNCGTTTTISVPLDDSIRAPSSTGPRQPFMGLQIGLIEPLQRDQNLGGLSRKLLLATLERSCQRLGAELTSSNGCNVEMLFEADLRRLDQRESAAPTIILCDSFMSAHQLRKSIEMQSRERHVECIAQPYGPLRLAGAIRACIDAAKDGHGFGHDPELSGKIGRLSGSHYSDWAVQRQSLDFMAAATTQGRAISSPADEPDASDLEDVTSAVPSDPYCDANTKTSLMRANEEKNIKNHLLLRSKSDNSQSSTTSRLAEPQPAAHAVPIRLLLVDDNTVNLRMLVTYADKNGYHRMTAVNGKEAVAAYENAAHPSANASANTALISHTVIPIVILLDINMPVMDGFEAARRIRAFERSHNLSPATIIAVTGLGSAEAQKKARASGMDLFLTKPVRPRELTTVLAPIVEASSLQVGEGAG